VTLPPQAPQHHHVTKRHGETIDDPYAWLKPSNWKEVMTAPDALDPEIRRHLEAEQAYTDAMLGPIQPLRETLFQEMKARIKTDDTSVPARDGPYLYYQRFSGDGEHPRLCRRLDAEDASEELLLDADAEAARHAFYRLGSTAHSPDHELLAFTADTTGNEFYTLRIKTLASGELTD
jgi:oligopeptidase B